MPPGTVYRSIRYLPSVEVDQLSRGGQGGLEPINSTLARRLSAPGLYELFFHANSQVVATENGRDVTAQYRILRRRRQWGAPLDGAAPSFIASGYVLDTGGNGPHGFGRDDGTDRSWFDTPGDRLTGPTTRSYRALQEFVTGIWDGTPGRRPIPDFGGLYYLVAIDVAPQKYRVIMSLEKRLTGAQIQGAMGVPGKAFPLDMVRGSPPDLTGWRFVSQDWLDYAQWLK